MTVLIIMFYRQEFYRRYYQRFLTLFCEWNGDVQKTKKQEEKLIVGIRLSFIISLL